MMMMMLTMVITIAPETQCRWSLPTFVSPFSFNFLGNIFTKGLKIIIIIL